MKSPASTVAEYLAALPEDRRQALMKVRAVVNRSLPAGYEERIGHGMISWNVPLAAHPQTYNGQPLCYAMLASEKNYMSLHIMCVYAEGPLKQRLVAGFAAAGKKLDMGKACIRFRTLDDLPLDVIGEIVAAVPMHKFIEIDRKVHAKKK
jgi:uncharacterized protein YdhG (YjbR/CyaY superfamily)